MIKRLSILSILVVLIHIILISCERDDICGAATPTTPLLVIDFLDAENPSQEKSPTNLVITSEDAVDITSENEVDPDRIIAFVNGVSTVSIPLRTDVDITTFLFTLNSIEDEEVDPNTDGIAFNYTRTEEFVSTACGFRVVYDGLEETRENLEDGPWIQDIDITNPTVNDETTTHVTILF